MSRSHYKIYETAYPYFMTSSFVEGIPVFADLDAAKIVLNSLVFLQTRRAVKLFAYVLMENHFHIIAQSKNLSEKMRHFKSYAAKEIINVFKQKKRTRLLRQLKDAKLKHKTESSYQLCRKGFIQSKLLEIR
jgi:hypothetical protein